MSTYYLPDLLSFDDYKIMSERFHRIIRVFMNESGKVHGETKRIVRYRSDRLIVIFRIKHDIRSRYELHIECNDGKDTYYVYDYKCPSDYKKVFIQASINAVPIEKTILKGEILDFIDDYCVIQEIDNSVGSML